MRVAYDGDHGADHGPVLDRVQAVLLQAGFYATRAVVTRVVTRWAEGAALGALGGTGVAESARVDPLVALLAAGLASAVGAWFGNQVVKEEQILLATHNPYFGWTMHDYPGPLRAHSSDSVMFPGGV